jgi:hypothetical protein
LRYSPASIASQKIGNNVRPSFAIPQEEFGHCGVHLSRTRRGYRRKGTRAVPTCTADVTPRILPSLAGLFLAARTEAYRFSNGCVSPPTTATPVQVDLSPAQERNAPEKCFQFGSVNLKTHKAMKYLPSHSLPSASGLLRCSYSFARAVASEEPARSPLAVRAHAQGTVKVIDVLLLAPN